MRYQFLELYLKHPPSYYKEACESLCLKRDIVYMSGYLMPFKIRLECHKVDREWGDIIYEQELQRRSSFRKKRGRIRIMDYDELEKWQNRGKPKLYDPASLKEHKDCACWRCIIKEMLIESDDYWDLPLYTKLFLVDEHGKYVNKLKDFGNNSRPMRKRNEV